jgi:hypothetical protein
MSGRRGIALAGMLLGAAAAVVALAGCGSASPASVQHHRARPVAQRTTASPATRPTTQTRSATTTTPPPTNAYETSQTCAGGVGNLVAGPHTSCPFAVAVEHAAFNGPGVADETVSVYSSVTQKTYQVRCASPPAGPVACTTGTASVQFPLDPDMCPATEVVTATGCDPCPSALVAEANGNSVCAEHPLSKQPDVPAAITTSTSADTTAQTSDPCPAGEFDPYGPQSGCYRSAHPPDYANPVSCPKGKTPEDGGCAVDCPSGEESDVVGCMKARHASDPCPDGYKQITEPSTACLAGGAKVVGGIDDDSGGAVNGIACPTGEQVIVGPTIAPPTGPDYDPYRCHAAPSCPSNEIETAQGCKTAVITVNCSKGADGASGECVPDSDASYADCVAAAKGQYADGEGGFSSAWRDGECVTGDTVYDSAPWWK